MNLKRLLPLLRGLFGIPEPEPVRIGTVSVPIAEPTAPKSRLATIYTSKKVLFASRSGRRLTARVVGMTDHGEIILRRAGHPNVQTFVRVISSVFLR